MVGFLVPALACTAVTGLGKSYQFVDDAAPGAPDAAAGGDGAKGDTATGVMCPPLIAGAYSMNDTGDCGGFDKSAKECISTTTSVNGNCALQFTSPGTGVNGKLEAQADGSFRTGVLVVGDIHHAECVATWALPATLTLACPSAGGNTCTVTMTRTLPMCL